MIKLRWEFIIIGVLLIIGGWHLNNTWKQDPAPLSGVWCSTQANVEPDWHSSIPVAMIAFGILFCVLGIFWEVIISPMEEAEEEDRGELETNPVSFLMKDWISYDYDSKKNPEISSIVVRRNGKEYTFRISEIEVKESAGHLH